MKKNCLMCGKLFTGRRSDSKFCCDSCKAKYAKVKSMGNFKDKTFTLGGTEQEHKKQPEAAPAKPLIKSVDMEDLAPFENLVGDNQSETQKKNDKPKNNTTSEGLSGKANEEENKAKFSTDKDQGPEKYIIKIIKTENPDYRNCVNRLNACRKEIGNFENNINKVTILLKELQAKFNLDLAKDWTQYDSLNKELQHQDKRIKKIIEDCKNMIFILREKEKLILFELPNYPAQIEKEEKTISLAYSFWKNIKSKETDGNKSTIQSVIHKDELANSEDHDPVNEDEHEDVNYPTKNENSIEENNQDQENSSGAEIDVINSIQEVVGMKFRLLNFDGRWEKFFGKPQTNFFAVIHGMSGEGKTNFSMQFAKYLTKFGSVLFISGEEGYASTFQQKIKDTGAANVARFSASKINTGKEILTKIPNKYNFIVIDSLNHMRIDPEMMSTIRNKFNKSGIIAICQSTKDGKIRGSYEIVHDCDIAVRVVNGIAVTTKNRFKKKGEEFDVFAIYRKNDKNKPDGNKPKPKRDDNDGSDFDFENTV